MSALSGFIVRFLGCMCSSRAHGVGCLSPKKVASFTERAGFDVGVCLLRKSVALALRGTRAGGRGGVRRAAPAGRGVGRRPGLAWQAAAVRLWARSTGQPAHAERSRAESDGGVSGRPQLTGWRCRDIPPAGCRVLCFLYPATARQSPNACCLQVPGRVSCHARFARAAQPACAATRDQRAPLCPCFAHAVRQGGACLQRACPPTAMKPLLCIMGMPCAHVSRAGAFTGPESPAPRRAERAYKRTLLRCASAAVVAPCWNWGEQGCLQRHPARRQEFLVATFGRMPTGC